MNFVHRYGCQIIAAPGGQLELFIPAFKSESESGVKPAEEMEVSNYQCLRVVVENTALVRANSWTITAARVLDKCDGGLAILEPKVDFIQHSKFLLGRSLVKMDGFVPIRVLNPTSYARQIYENTLAAL